MQDFKKLKIWQKGKELTLAMYKVTSSFPSEEKFGITSQLRRASSSIPANIAEGCGRISTKDFRVFTHSALGSSKEIESFLLLSKELGYINETQFQELMTEYVTQLQKMITKFIQALNRKIDEEKRVRDLERTQEQQIKSY